MSIRLNKSNSNQAVAFFGCILLFYMPVPMFGDHLAGKSLVYPDYHLFAMTMTAQTVPLGQVVQAFRSEHACAKSQLFAMGWHRIQRSISWLRRAHVLDKKTMETAFSGWGQPPDSRVNVELFGKNQCLSRRSWFFSKVHVVKRLMFEPQFWGVDFFVWGACTVGKILKKDQK